jgi:hypothetical protein
MLGARRWPTTGTLVLNWGQCTLKAAPGTLTLHAEAAGQDSLIRIRDLVAGRLEKFGRREHLTVTWQQAQTSPGAPDATAGPGALSLETGTPDRNNRRRRLS